MLDNYVSAGKPRDEIVDSTPQSLGKRAQSQHNARKKYKVVNSAEPTTDVFAEIEKIKKAHKNLNVASEGDDDRSPSPGPYEEDKDVTEEDLNFQQDIASKIKQAEAKIKATADAMLLAQKADLELEEKIRALKDRGNGSNSNHVTNLNNQSNGLTRQERIANIVQEIVAQSTDITQDNNDLYSGSDEDTPYLDSNSKASKNFSKRDSLVNKSLEPIKEQFTEEFHG